MTGVYGTYNLIAVKRDISAEFDIKYSIILMTSCPIAITLTPSRSVNTGLKLACSRS
jgi:hypothetical protein